MLVLLFIDEPKLNTTRLHRVLRNLCYHGPTRDWVVKSLLSILERSNEARANVTELYPITSTPSTKGKRITSRVMTATPPSDVKVHLQNLVSITEILSLRFFIRYSMPRVFRRG